jgi:hypothetical protein
MTQLAWGQSETAGSQHPYFELEHTLSAGVAYQDFDAEFGATRKGLLPATLDLDTLGIDPEDTTWKVGYRWRFADRWQLVASAYTFSNDGKAEVEEDFNYDGVEFTAGVGITTSLQVDTYVVDALYSVYRSDRAEVSLGGGLHAFNFEAEITGKLSAGDLEATRSNATDTILAPLPNFRAQAFYAINKKIGVGATAGWLSANYDDYEGDFVYMNVRSSYNFTPRFAATVSYQFTDIDLKYEPSSMRENEYNIDFHGPSLELSYCF